VTAFAVTWFDRPPDRPVEGTVFVVPADVVHQCTYLDAAASVAAVGVPVRRGVGAHRSARGRHGVAGVAAGRRRGYRFPVTVTAAERRTRRGWGEEAGRHPQPVREDLRA
jgi:hypothetical protein